MYAHCSDFNSHRPTWCLRKLILSQHLIWGTNTKWSVNLFCYEYACSSDLQMIRNNWFSLTTRTWNLRSFLITWYKSIHSWLIYHRNDIKVINLHTQYEVEVILWVWSLNGPKTVITADSVLIRDGLPQLRTISETFILILWHHFEITLSAW